MIASKSLRDKSNHMVAYGCIWLYVMKYDGYRRALMFKMVGIRNEPGNSPSQKMHTKFGRKWKQCKKNMHFLLLSGPRMGLAGLHEKLISRGGSGIVLARAKAIVFS